MGRALWNPTVGASVQPVSAKEDEGQGLVARAKKSDPAPQIQATPAPQPVPEKLAGTESSASVGTVSVTSDPDGAEILVDSVGHGHDPAILKLSPGKHSRGFQGLDRGARGEVELDR